MLHRLAIAASVAVLAPLAPGPSAFAAELYRWAESDGSITFSPNRPPEGIAFETVEAGGSTTPPIEATADAPDAGPAPAPTASPPTLSPVATPRPTARPAPGTAVADTGYAPTPPPGPGTGVTFAPPPLGAAVATTQRESLQAGSDAIAPATPPSSPETATDTAAVPDVTDAHRRSQCRELEKRVVSLERSLMIEMPPERMDDTVLSMARYQGSLDDHCRR